MSIECEIKAGGWRRWPELRRRWWFVFVCLCLCVCFFFEKGGLVFIKYGYVGENNGLNNFYLCLKIIFLLVFKKE